MSEDDLILGSSYEMEFDDDVDLQGWLNIHVALYGTYPILLINQQQPLSSTEGIPYKVFLSPRELTEYVKRAFITPSMDLFEINVFDGQRGHVVNLTGFDQASNSFLYEENWEEGSFLDQNHNQAGVAAVPVPDQPRIWRVSRAELETVIYSIPFPPSIWAELKGLKYQVLYPEVQQSEFFYFLNLHEKRRESLQDGQVRIWLETGGFQQFNEIFLELDQLQRVSRATLRLDRNWIVPSQWGVNPFGTDIAKSFITALIPPADADEVKKLVNGLWELIDLEKALTNLGVEGRQSPLPLLARHVLYVYLGLEEKTQWILLFSTIRAENDNSRGWINLSIDIHLNDHYAYRR